MYRPRYRISRQAVADLQHIADYIRNHNPPSAERVMNALHKTFRFVALNPGVGSDRDDLHPGLRLVVPSKPASSYIVFYYPTADGVEVSDVIHAARDWMGMFASGER